MHVYGAMCARMQSKLISQLSKQSRRAGSARNRMKHPGNPGGYGQFGLDVSVAGCEMQRCEAILQHRHGFVFPLRRDLITPGGKKSCCTLTMVLKHAATLTRSTQLPTNDAFTKDCQEKSFWTAKSGCLAQVTTDVRS